MLLRDYFLSWMERGQKIIVRFRSMGFKIQFLEPDEIINEFYIQVRNYIEKTYIIEKFDPEQWLSYMFSNLILNLEKMGLRKYRKRIQDTEFYDELLKIKRYHRKGENFYKAGFINSSFHILQKNISH